MIPDTLEDWHELNKVRDENAALRARLAEVERFNGQLKKQVMWLVINNEALTDDPDAHARHMSDFDLRLKRAEQAEREREDIREANVLMLERAVTAERERDEARKERNQLNSLLREVGWGQGEIDSSAVVAEENEALRAELKSHLSTLLEHSRIFDRVNAENAALREEYLKLREKFDDALVKFATDLATLQAQAAMDNARFAEMQQRGSALEVENTRLREDLEEALRPRDTPFNPDHDLD